MGPLNWLRKVALDRAKGRKPSPIRALMAACLVAVGAGGITYKALRK